MHPSAWIGNWNFRQHLSSLWHTTPATTAMHTIMQHSTSSIVRGFLTIAIALEMHAKIIQIAANIRERAPTKYAGSPRNQGRMTPGG